MICDDLTRARKLICMIKNTVCIKSGAFSTVYCSAITDSVLGTATIKITEPLLEVLLRYPKLEKNDLFCTWPNSEIKLTVVSIPVFVFLCRWFKCTKRCAEPTVTICTIPADQSVKSVIFVTFFEKYKINHSYRKITSPSFSSLSGIVRAGVETPQSPTNSYRPPCL